MSRRQIQKEDTRRVILQAAYLLFAEKGYRQATMRALAERAGVGLGTIFKHFPDKPSILAAAFQEDLKAIIEKAFNTLPPEGLKEQLLHLTENIYQFYSASPAFSRDLIKEVLFLEGEQGEVLRRQVLSFLDEISMLIESAVKRGELESGTDAQSGALAYWSFYFTGLLTGLNEAEFNVSAQVGLVEKLIDEHFLTGR